MTENKAHRILDALRQDFKLPDWRNETRDAFETLVRTVISQNTTSRNTARAFENLSKRFEITPESLSKANEAEVEEAIRVAGLHRNKGRALKKLSSVILEEYGGRLDFIFEVPLEQAREKLLELPGVGPKTADVVLLFSAKKPTLPVDTHVDRVSKKLALVDVRADYEHVRKRLQLLFNHADYYAVHVLFILLGRRFCLARRPLCSECPINELCPSKLVVG
ncbi:MAG: endonuclease III [Candidatus Bathyarchaeota archaeon]|nr:endonuclease III [Candidatus Bathyarchaeota archaeon]